VKRVIFAPPALADLIDIGTYIEFDSPIRARTYVDELYRKALNIGLAPQAYPKREDLRRGLRMAVHGKHLIFFHVLKDRVEIVRILHGARDLPRLLGE
jgi:toxin ParE1/3/4